jgi:LAGLIDADG endonuclease
LHQLKTEEPYNSDIVIQTQLIARMAPNLSIRYYQSLVKNLITRSKPAGIRQNSNIILPQRLNAVELKKAMLVGFVEGDGWFTVSKKGKYLMYEFGIELNIRDIQLIYNLKEFLGVGTVTFRNTEGRSKTVIFRIRNKSHFSEGRCYFTYIWQLSSFI